MNNSPFIYYPWQPDFVSQSIHHELRTDTPQKLQNTMANIRKKWKNYDMNEKLNRTFYMDTIYTTDNKQVLYGDLYSDTKSLSALLTSEKEKGSLLCCILSLYNPVNPHLKPINCYKWLLKSFICEKFIPIQNSIITLDSVISYERYGLIKCTNGQYVSTLYTCDGHWDFSDGTDELNCYCFKNGKMIMDNIYSKTCSLKSKFTCSSLFTNQGSDGCHSSLNPKLIQDKVFKSDSNYTHFTYLCMNSSLNISSALINDLVFDCPYQDDEPVLFNK